MHMANFYYRDAKNRDSRSLSQRSSESVASKGSELENFF